MATRIDVPGMGVVEFPDGMSDAQIADAIKRNAPQAPLKADPTEGIGTPQAIAIAAGRTTDKVVQGVRQVYNKATGDKATLAKMAEDEAEKDRLYKPLKDAKPIATGVGEALPMLAVPIAGPGGVVARSAAAGALPGALSYGSAEERLKAASVGAAGGAVGGAIGAGIGRVLQPAGTAAQGISATAAEAAERVGMRLSPGQKSGNPAMQNFENYLAKSPGSSGAMLRRQQDNTAAVNRTAAKEIGQSGDELSEGMFATAKKAIGSEFERLQAITSPKLGNDFFAALSKIDGANRARESFASKEIDGLVTKGLDLAVKGKLSGTAYKEIRTQLTSEAQAAFKAGDATTGQAYKTLRKALDDAAEASLSAADQKAWAATREQWKAYKTLTQSNVAEAGNVSPARLASAMRRDNPDGFRTGAQHGGLMDIARVGEAVKGSQNPNSGQLAQIQAMAMNPTALGALMLGGNKLAQAAYTSKPVEWYLANGLLKIGPTGQLIATKLGGPAGAPLVQNYLGAR